MIMDENVGLPFRGADAGAVMIVSPEEISAARTGDPDARDTLMAKIGPIVDRLVARRGRTSRTQESLDREDLRQDVLLRVLSSLPTFAGVGGGQLVGWLAAVVRTVHLDALRGRNGTRENCGDTASGCLQPDDSANPRAEDPALAASAKEWNLRLAKAMESLPVRFRTVLETRIMAGLSFAEVASTLSLGSSNAAECLFRRALKDLQSTLDEKRHREWFP